jgi:diguanylate cyclase (GGDEF)-like protein/putative nucleotidyltransferase with HDIG domain
VSTTHTGLRDATLSQLRGLLQVAEAVRAGNELEPALEAIASAISATLGYKAVVINLYRPAWDDFEVVVVLGNEESRALLMGERSCLEDWSGLLHERFCRHGSYLVPAGEYDWASDGMASYHPEIAPVDDPDAWHADDALMVPLCAGTGALLGIVSLDEPVTGRRPSDFELEILGAVAAHAALAVEHAQEAADARRHRAAVEHLLLVSSQLTGRHSAKDMLESVCAGVREALGFQKVIVFLVEGEERMLAPQATVGSAGDEPASFPPFPAAAMADLLEGPFERHGCLLVPAEEATRRTPAVMHGIYTSVCNGCGPLAWNHHWLVVPLQDRDGVLTGLLWVDDPEDRLLPTDERLKALRAFANQAASAIESTRQLERMRHLAEHDALTGLRNRRDFELRIEAGVGALGSDRRLSLLVCDLDHFKRINDALGHEAGDEALRRFAEILSSCAPAGEVPTRLGGEEFALALPGIGEVDALAVAEHLRLLVRGEFADFPGHISVSVGVASVGQDAPDAAGLVRAANRALYAAKRLGRDRCVVHHLQTLEMLDSMRDPDGGAGEQLAAAMLLAETLDLRDVATARHSQTVGRYSEQIARELGFSAPRVERLRAAGILHDIGKLGIADLILHKPGPLDAQEWLEIKRHPELGARILEHANLRDIGAWVLAHHERLDGGGYPHGLGGEEIPVEARILAVADAYEAMTADRPYRRALGVAAAREQLRSGAGTQFDSGVVGAFLRLLERSEPSFEALLPAVAASTRSPRTSGSRSERAPSGRRASPSGR